MMKPYQAALLLTIIAAGVALSILAPWAQAAEPVGPMALPQIVFVARAHLATQDNLFKTEVGPAGQFGTGLSKFAPGSQLMIRQSDGSLVTLIDGKNPMAATNYLIDVQSPDVSFDGSKIIFAGATTTDPESTQYGWRLYEIRVNGTGFRKLPIPDRPPTFTIPHNNPNSYNFGNQETYGWWNDLFPSYLADGRIVFASSRYPTRAHYDERHTYNLYIFNESNGSLRRITTDRGGLLHPTPLPDGRIMTTRWWNNFNQPSEMGVYNRIDNQPTTHSLSDGTVINANVNQTFNPATGTLRLGYPIRQAPNTWHIMALNPDGSGFERFAFTPYHKYNLTEDDGLDTYVAAQPSVVMVGNELRVAYTMQRDPTMAHSTLETGIRVARPGVAMMYSNTVDAIAGMTFYKAIDLKDTSPPYALHPWGMPDGAILFSYVINASTGLPTSGAYTDRVTGQVMPLQGSQLQYQLYTMNVDGSNKTLLTFNAPGIGTADAMDAKPIIARVGWTAKPDTFTAIPNDDPRLGNVPNTLPQYPFSLRNASQILTATLHNPNVYANPPLALPFINNSPMPGSIAWAQVYIDANQFTGAYCYGNNPNPCNTFKQDNELRAVLWTEVPVSLRGEFTAVVPADTPGFVLLRDANKRVVSGWNRGYISIAQGNAWARPGQTVQCVGCHLGHVSGSLTSVLTDVVSGWTNIAPYASVGASSTYNPAYFAVSRLNDRRGWVPIPVGGPGGPYADDAYSWISADNQALGATIAMTWTIPMSVTKVRLIGPPPTGGDWDGFGVGYPTGSPYRVTSGTLRFYLGGVQVGAYPIGQIEPLTNGGTTVSFATPIKLDRLTFTINAVAGDWYGNTIAALNEIEVIGMATQIYTVNVRQNFLPLIRR
jgi:hypothetical protein